MKKFDNLLIIIKSCKWCNEVREGDYLESNRERRGIPLLYILMHFMFQLCCLNFLNFYEAKKVSPPYDEKFAKMASMLRGGHGNFF